MAHAPLLLAPHIYLPEILHWTMHMCGLWSSQSNTVDILDPRQKITQNFQALMYAFSKETFKTKMVRFVRNKNDTFRSEFDPLCK